MLLMRTIRPDVQPDEKQCTKVWLGAFIKSMRGHGTGKELGGGFLGRLVF